MIPRAIDQISQEDINALVDDAVAERRTLEYKQELPGRADNDKREFCADVSSFANASGGDLVYGVIECDDDDGKPTGIAEAAPGLQIQNSSSEILRLEQVLQSGVSPKIPGARFRVVEGFANGPVVVLRVPRSWAGPHAVRVNDGWRFYSRNSQGKYPLDLDEIRSAFVSSETFAERAATFRRDRVVRIVSAEAPVALDREALIVLHIFVSHATNEFLAAAEPIQSLDLLPIVGGANLRRFNFDGVLIPGGTVESGRYDGCVQVFRHGAVEAVDTQLLRGSQNKIPSIAFERQVIAAVERYLHFLRRTEIEPPVAVMLSLTGVQGYEMGISNNVFHWEQTAIDRDVLLVPEVVTEDLECDVPGLLRPVFDTVWQSAGFPKSIDYDEQGAWRQDLQ